MIRGLYTSAWSMLADSKKMDVISNNIANVNTNAYKKDTMVYESFPAVLTRRIKDTTSPANPTGNVGTMQLGSDAGEIFTYYNQGHLMKSDNTLDLAIQNSDAAFFTVGIPGENGEMKEYYTRDGAFAINADQQLVTKDGHPVMGTNGPVTLKDDNFSVEADGKIVQNGQVIDRLMIKQFTDSKTLRKYGTNLVEKTDGTQEQEFSGIVNQGFLEQSNVNIIKEMVDMISVMRSYEANQKLMQNQDSTLEKLVNEVGALR